MIAGIAPATQQPRIPYGRHLDESGAAMGFWLLAVWVMDHGEWVMGVEPTALAISRLTTDRLTSEELP